MDLVVIPDPVVPHRGTLIFEGREIPCALGRGGVRADKREGDGATPIGRFPIRRVMFREDRLGKLTTALPAAAIARDDGWCDDADDAAYNKPVKLPYAGRTESMWRDDHVYDAVVILGHNDDPVVAGAGSAIFLHMAKPEYTGTEGCVAVARDDLFKVLKALKPGDGIEIRAA